MTDCSTLPSNAVGNKHDLTMNYVSSYFRFAPTVLIIAGTAHSWSLGDPRLNKISVIIIVITAMILSTTLCLASR